MFAEWYFCCCISANPSDTEAFLSILESIENPESDSRLLYLAYNELRHAQDRMQIYAIPAVLRSLHRENLPAELKNTIKRYLKNLVERHLVENVPERVENRLRQLMNSALSDRASTQGTIEAARTFAKDSQDLPERRLSPTPYLDLKEFLPETLVLAILADQVENDEKLIGELVDELVTEEVNEQDETSSSSPIRTFLEAALDCQFGRLAFRLAASIASLTASEDPESLRSLIAKKASMAAQAEPDLLQTYAIVLYRDEGTKETAPRQCQRIIQESLTLSELRNLIREVPNNRDSNALDASFRRVGIQQNTRNRTECLPVFYWQIALWELAAQIDVSTTADKLAKFWHPPSDLPQDLSLYVNCSETDDPGQVEVQFKSILNLLGITKKNTLKVRKSITLKNNLKKRFHPNEGDIGLFFSPWIARTKKQHRLYPAADKPTATHSQYW